MALHSHGAAPHDANVSGSAHWFARAKLPAPNLPLAPADASLLVSVKQRRIVNNGLYDAWLPN
jgi:ethanolamine utilization protein EutA (predicted chaperonin)